MKLSNYFNKIYCINLNRRIDRWESVQKEFQKYNLEDIQRYEAIDGSKLTDQTKLLKGELGVLNTHIEIIKKSINESCESILIIEDDVIFTDEIKLLDDYLKEVPENWDFIYFGGNHVYGKTVHKITNKILKLNYTVALQCVAIKNTQFEKILQITQKKEKQIDAYYADLHNSSNAYGFFPNMAKQKPDFSDIQNRFVDYNYFFK